MSYNLGKKTEFIHAENARSKIIGTIEKREGQTVLGTNSVNKPFVTTANYGIFSFQNNNNQGFYRISVAENSTLSINVTDNILVTETFLPSTLSIIVTDKINITEKINNNTGDIVTIYYLNSSNQWIPLSGLGANIAGGIFDYTYAEGCTFLVNQNSDNRYIDSDGITVYSSTSTSGHLYNTPPASRINYYKNRLYLADFIENGIRYPTTVLRSSYPVGIVSLINEDRTISNTVWGYVTTNGTTTLTGSGSKFLTTYKAGDIITVSGETARIVESVTSDTVLVVTQPFSTSTGPLSYSLTGCSIEVTDTKYLYADSGVNVYDVYRGDTLMTVLTVTQVNENSVNATWSGAPSLLSSDEIWVNGTHNSKKIFRWVKNSSSTGNTVKQYDTFKLSGGENDPITMLTNIGNVMITANKNAMTSWNDYTLENFDLDIGCVSKKGYIKLNGVLYFLHYNGVYATSGSTPERISNKIEKYINGATKIGKENSAAGKKGSSIFFTLGDVVLYREDGSVNKTLKDVCIEYNIIQTNWYIHTNVKANEFATFVEESNTDRLELADTSDNHAIKEFLSGETDDGKEINFRIDTMKLTPGAHSTSTSSSVAAFEYSSKPIGLLAEAIRGSAMKVFVNTDNSEDYYPLEGQITKGLSVIKIKGKDPSRGDPPVCRLISFSIRDSSKQICKLSRLTLVYLPTTDEEQDNDL